MEFYAKSKKHDLKPGDKEKIKSSYSNLLEDMGEFFSKSEIVALENEKNELMKDAVEEQKTLRRHLEETVGCAELFFEEYGQYFSEKEKYLIYTACKYHDVGKANLFFQSIISDQGKYQNVKQIPHGFLSALTLSLKELQKECNTITNNDFKCLVTAIYYHHTRDDGFTDHEIREFSDRYFKDCFHEFISSTQWKTSLKNRTNLLFHNSREYPKEPVRETLWQEYLLIKGMLNKFDWTVSGGREESEETVDLDKKELIGNIEKKYKGKLRAVQKYMKDHVDQSVVIIAPTGSGKTEAALYWLNGEKGFYTLPLKVSSNAIYKRIREEYKFQNVALLHSDSFQQYIDGTVNNMDAENKDKKNESAQEKFNKAKMFSAPLTVTTVDQLFLFVYKTLGTEIMAATLKYSKVIIDEIQSYEPRIVAALIYGLKIISRMGGKFAIITATLPPILLDFMKQYEMVKDETYCLKDFSKENVMHRHMIHLYEQEFNEREIAEEAKTKKVLVICNTVKKAQEMYLLLEEWNVNVYLLHAKYIRKHRKILEENIMQFSESKESVGVWVTTQIVEASLDIDFDVLYTEMCTADSLLQRMGRCNRKERYIPLEPNIKVYKTANAEKQVKSNSGDNGMYYGDLFERSWECLATFEDILFTEEQKIKYIDEVYDADKVKDTEYYKEIEAYLEYFEGLPVNELSKREGAEKFRMIQSISVIPDKIYYENMDLIEQYKQMGKSRYLGKEAKAILKAKLDDLTISVTLYNQHSWSGIDKSVIENTDIHRTNYVYDFDEDTGRGIGLSATELEENNML